MVSGLRTTNLEGKGKVFAKKKFEPTDFVEVEIVSRLKKQFANTKQQIELSHPNTKEGGKKSKLKRPKVKYSIANEGKTITDLIYLQRIIMKLFIHKYF